MRERNICAVIFIAILLGVFVVPSGRVFAGEGKSVIPEYDLSVSFDLKKNLLRGTAVIVFPEAQEIVVSTGNLPSAQLPLTAGLLSTGREMV